MEDTVNDDVPIVLHLDGLVMMAFINFFCESLVVFLLFFALYSLMGLFFAENVG